MTILDKNKIEGITIENEYWLSEAKIAMTALAILIAISKEKAKVKIHTNSKIIKSVFNELEERKESKSTTTKEDLGQLKYAIRLMLEIKETRIEIVYDKELQREIELPRMRTELDTYNFDGKSCYATYNKKLVTLNIRRLMKRIINGHNMAEWRTLKRIQEYEDRR